MWFFGSVYRFMTPIKALKEGVGAFATAISA
jgi:hypothetical protein